MYSELEQLLRIEGDGASLREAVMYYLAHHKKRRFKPMTFSDCETTFIEHQETDGVTTPQIKTLKKHFRRFKTGTSKENPVPFGERTIDSFDALEIATWLKNQKSQKTGNGWESKTKINVLGSLVSLSIFARDTLKAIPGEGATEFQNVKKPKLPQRGPVDIYLPDEFEKLLYKAVETDIELLPVLVLGGLEGLRPSECHGEGLDRPPFSWEELDWPNKQVLVTGQKVRSRKTRPVPLHRATALWLKPFRNLRGPIWTHSDAHTKKLLALRKATGVRSVYDGFRRSYASFRIKALKGDLTAVASEMGNSPEELLGAYRRNVTDDEVAEWFGIVPPKDYSEKIASLLALRRAAEAVAPQSTL